MATKTLPQSGSSTPRWGQIRTIAISVILLGFLIAFGLWGGLPEGDRINAFVLGIVVLTVFLFALAGVTWYLLFKPLPVGQEVQAQPLKASYRRITAIFLGVGSIGIAVGGFWDEVWHRAYGLPFGKDFFWRPHLLMYFGFAVVVVLAFGALFMINTNGKGTFQQRFRANPVFGLLILMGAFLMFALPADPIWHGIYGADLGAWSVPHLLLAVCFTTMMLLSVAVHMTLLPRREWSSFLHLSTDDLLPMIMLGAMPLMWMQIFTVEWDAGSTIVNTRPDWLLPMLIITGATLIGVLANHSTRRWGSATIAGLIALGIRALLIRVFGVNNMYTNAWAMELVPMVLIDLWCAYRVQTKQYPSWIGSGIAAALGMAAVIFLMFKTSYPNLVINNMPLTLIVVLLSSLGASWAGAKIGDYVAESNKQAEPASATSRIRLPLATLGALAVACLLFAFFIYTATPPV